MFGLTALSMLLAKQLHTVRLVNIQGCLGCIGGSSGSSRQKE